MEMDLGETRLSGNVSCMLIVNENDVFGTIDCMTLNEYEWQNYVDSALGGGFATDSLE